jgi:hypothetical protein
VENHGSVIQHAGSSMMSSKAKLMAETINSGTIDQVREQMMLLQQFKESFVNVQDQVNGGQGQMDHHQTALDLICELPFLKKRCCEELINSCQAFNVCGSCQGSSVSCEVGDPNHND